MKLRRLCKSAGSTDDEDCPSMYIADDRWTMVSQGKVLDIETTAQLRNLARDENAVAIPTETVLRATGLFLAEHGHPGVLAEIDAFLAGAAERDLSDRSGVTR